MVVETFPGNTLLGGWALTVIDRLIESAHCWGKAEEGTERAVSDWMSEWESVSEVK